MKETTSTKDNEIKQYVYVGPTIRSKFFLERWTVVKDKSFYIKKMKELEGLFVQIEGLSEAINSLKDKGSKLYKAFVFCQQKEHELLKHIQGGR